MKIQASAEIKKFEIYTDTNETIIVEVKERCGLQNLKDSSKKYREYIVISENYQGFQFSSMKNIQAALDDLVDNISKQKQSQI